MFLPAKGLQRSDARQEYRLRGTRDRLSFGHLISSGAMTRRGQIRWLLAAFLVFAPTLAPIAVSADEPVRVAVASNFAGTMRDVVDAFEAATGHTVTLSPASTGKLFAQIRNGAPFDVFLAADVARPEALEASGHAIADTRFTYAVGRLVLWSADRNLVDRHCRDALVQESSGRLAIANPRTAPYGRAAEQVLIALDESGALRDRLVVGENVGQTLQFAATGNARFAFVSAAQLHGPLADVPGCRWDVPGDLHSPVEQQVVLLRNAAESSSARALLAFLKSEQGRRLIETRGYTVPDDG